jgi:hypothetical protein
MNQTITFEAPSAGSWGTITDADFDDRMISLVPLEAVTVVNWSNAWPDGDVARMQRRVWREWWVRVR